MNSKPEAQASGEHRMHSPLRSAVARWFFAKAKDDSQNVRDNNAARVAGLGRICFLQPSRLSEIFVPAGKSKSVILQFHESAQFKLALCRR